LGLPKKRTLGISGSQDLLIFITVPEVINDYPSVSFFFFKAHAHDIVIFDDDARMGRVRMASISSIKEEDLPHRRKSRRSSSLASTRSQQRQQKNDHEFGTEGCKNVGGEAGEETGQVACSNVSSKETYVKKHKELHTRH
jgi:hypothetical protein